MTRSQEKENLQGDIPKALSQRTVTPKRLAHSGRFNNSEDSSFFMRVAYQTTVCAKWCAKCDSAVIPTFSAIVAYEYASGPAGRDRRSHRRRCGSSFPTRDVRETCGEAGSYRCL